MNECKALPVAHINSEVTTTALSPILSAMTPPEVAAAMPSNAVSENSSPTSCVDAFRACTANHGMHVNFATNPSALADAHTFV